MVAATRAPGVTSVSLSKHAATMNTPEAQRPRSGLFSRIALVTLSVLLGLGVLEVGLRSTGATPIAGAPILACAKKNGLATLDSYDARVASGQPRQLCVQWHLNQAGNALIARLVAGALATAGGKRR